MKEKQSGKIKEKEFDSLSDCQYIFPDLLRDDVNGFVVNSRVLHRELGNKRQYTDWIKHRIAKYNFVENVDFVIKQEYKTNIEKSYGGDRKSKVYLITIQMAKYLCGVEKNEEGAKISKYLASSKEEKVVIIEPKRKDKPHAIPPT